MILYFALEVVCDSILLLAEMILMKCLLFASVFQSISRDALLLFHSFIKYRDYEANGCKAILQ